jgi:signal recognition particle subunit SRP72
MQQTAGGAEFFIPKKRNRKVKYPKDYDPANPGPEPDHERWLPKWQRSKYKKMAKKLGKYLKGAQGDSQVDTDVTKLDRQSTAHQQVTQQRTNKRKRK